MSNASTPSSTTSSAQVPRVGGVRCYWALVTPKFPVRGMHESQLALKFVHPDPVLGAHLARQQMTMVGRDMLDFIHPNEREQARADLGGAISTNDLQGSVTRVRFARLSRIREILGGTRDEIEYPTDAKTFVEDEEYLILDLVLNWVADGLLLAFFHAIRDKDPVSNNDPSKRHEEWTNFCGTANMPEDQLDALHVNLANTLNPAPQTRYPPTRVFQLHTTDTSPTRPNQLVFSWPPPRPPSEYGQRWDGRYDAYEYSDLMKGVEMDPSALETQETRTNCTTRFGASHSLATEGVYRVISSVFIPYGNLIFACYQTVKLVDPTPPSRSPTSTGRNDLVDSPNNDGSWPSPPEGETSDQDKWRTPENQRTDSWEFAKPQQSLTPGSNGHGHNGHDHSHNPDPYPHHQYPAPHSHEPEPYPPHQLPDPHPHQHHHHQQQQQPEPHPEQHHQYPDSHPEQHQSTQPAPQQAYPPPPPPPPAPLSHQQGYDRDYAYDQGRSAYPPPPPPPPSLPPSHAHSQSQYDPPQIPHLSHRSTYPPPPPPPSYPPPPPQPQLHPHDPRNWMSSRPRWQHEHSPPNNGSSSRPLIPPPVNVECCVMCGIKESPEWRRNESGIKDLCNACGLRLARQVAKREGRQKPRKKQLKP